MWKFMREAGSLGHRTSSRNRLGVLLAGLTSLAGAFLASPAAAQVSVTFTGDRDNTLYEDTQGDVSAGASVNMIVGRTNGSPSNPGGPSGFKRRCLVHFNISSIPAGSTITSATLTLYLNQVSSNGDPGNTTIGVHKLLADWGEGSSNGNGQGGAATNNDATWVHRFYPNQTWSAVGGQFTGAASDTTNHHHRRDPHLDLGDHGQRRPRLAEHPRHQLRLAPQGRRSQRADHAPLHHARGQHPFAAPPSSPSSTRPPAAPAAIAARGSVMTQAACTSSGGIYQGNNTDCSPNPCPPPTGACCTNNVCSIASQATCEAGGGTYMGNGTDCHA